MSKSVIVYKEQELRLTQHAQYDTDYTWLDLLYLKITHFFSYDWNICVCTTNKHG